MAQEIDVYREWLGITETARPLNNYQLLRLTQFEDDASKIRDNYRKMNAHVRKFSSGDYASRSQQLLNELAKAMLCLTDVKRKGEYDASLGRKSSAAEGVRRTLEELLISRKLVDQAQLTKARNYANTVGVEIRDALVQQKLVKSDAVMQAYAESIGLPYIDLADVSLDESLIPRIPAVLARTHSCVPVMVDDKQVLMATPNPLLPDVEEELRLRLGMPVRTVLCTVGGVNERIAKYYTRDAAAAEMSGKAPAAAGAVPQKSADGKTAAPSKAAAVAAAPTRTPAEAASFRNKVALLSFNFSFMIVVLTLYSGLRWSVISAAAVGAVVGGIAAGIGYMVAKSKS